MRIPVTTENSGAEIRRLQELGQFDSTPPTIVLPASGRILFRHRIDEPDQHLDFVVRLDQPGPVAIQVRSLKHVRPFLRTKWTASPEENGEDTDSGSGRGGDCFHLVDVQGFPDNWVHCSINGMHGSTGEMLVCIWRPPMLKDYDPDVFGPESSMLALDNFDRAQIPSQRNMRPPKIDYPGDVDTFQIWPRTRGKLTITIDGYRSGLQPRLDIYDRAHQRLVYSGPTQSVSVLHRFSINNAGPADYYYLGVRSWDGESTGEYTLSVHLDQ